MNVQQKILGGLSVALLCLPMVSLAKPPQYPTKEASVVFPLENATQMRLENVHEDLKSAFLENWGNYRATPVTQAALVNGAAVAVPAVLYTVTLKCDNTEPSRFVRTIRAAQANAQLTEVASTNCNGNVMHYSLQD